ncbi:uncharacterized protein AMSG_10801 [Thecamonas trahens ATCC 50062]|uniref:Tyrosine-protein kinase ephrin type A/B receptor-like domain-containing protein n=1 Tax=Thecamonas trahens ATCC 50062 TaxID=461836 RepID=A0A0L0DSE0_THETB|nr:hypothetical protein AMSG_10801 [Thecamonas trahens ATCC 50062]KNC55185.1 hypothetical protein AMSG_10801 [Thecamonas trahens ATCC 50062]|eukprot:XP_013753237.1 hypothetical protein AMSG_10801 [Thecamonas trahens ATCC 50062]
MSHVVVVLQDSLSPVSWLTPVTYSASAVQFGEMGDLSGDGHADVVAATSGGHFAWWSNNGSGVLTSKPAIAAGLGLRRLVIVDIDSDNDADLLAADYSGSAVVLATNDAGDGSSWTVSTVSVTSGVWAVVVGDFNADSLLDVAHVSSTTSGLGWAMATTPGVFGPKQSVPGPSQGKDVAATDADADGDIDLVVAAVSKLVVYLNTGSGASFSPVELYSNIDDGQFLGVFGVEVADVDGDGLFDWILSANNSGRVFWFSAAATQSAMLYPFDVGTQLVSPAVANVLTVAAGDIDNDGWEDVVSQQSTGVVNVYRNQGGTGSFANGITVMTIPDPIAGGLVLADLDQDGELDMVAASAPGSGGSIMGCWSLPVSLSCVFPFSVSLVDLPRWIEVSDVDADGFLDVLWSDVNGVHWVQNVGKEEAWNNFHLVTATGTTATNAVGDIDADGDVDVAVVSGNDVVVLGNTGNGTFAVVDTAVPPPPLSTLAANALMIADLNVDGLGDIVGCGSGGNRYVFAAVQIAPGVFGPIFGLATVVDFPGVGTDLIVTDLNSDSVPDLVVATSNLLFAHVNMYGDPTGTWSSQQLRETDPQAVYHVVNLDADGVGLRDIAYSRYNELAAHTRDVPDMLDAAAWRPTFSRVLGSDVNCRSLREPGSCVSGGDVHQLPDGKPSVVEVGHGERHRRSDRLRPPQWGAFRIGTNVSVSFAGLSAINSTGTTMLMVEGEGAELVLTHCHFATLGSTLSNGAVVSVTSGGVLVMTDSTAVDNLATIGGAVFVVSGTLRLERVHFSLNRATMGGGSVYSRDSSSIIIGCTFENGSTFSFSSFGGGIAFEGGTALIANSKFARLASGNGGCVTIYGRSFEVSVEIVDTTFVDCSARSVGGAVNIALSTSVSRFLMTRVSISNCHAAEIGGGIHIRSVQDAVLTDVTISSTSADLAGGALACEDFSSSSVSSTKVWDLSPVASGTSTSSVTMAGSGLSMTSVSAGIGGGLFLCSCTVSGPMTIIDASASAAGGAGFGCVSEPAAFPASGPPGTVSSSVGADGYGPGWATVPEKFVWIQPPSARIGSALLLAGVSIELLDGVGQRVRASEIRIGVTILDVEEDKVENIGPTAIPQAGDGSFSLVSSSLGMYGPPYDDVPLRLEVGLTDGVRSDLASTSTIAVTLTACPPGTGGGPADESPWLVCTVCGVSEVSEETSVAPCALRDPCPDSTVAVEQNRTVSCVCKDGFYSHAGRVEGEACDECPPGGLCALGSDEPVPLVGFYPVGDGTFVACRRAAGCVGGSNVAPCRRGYSGFMCNECEAGHYSDASGACVPCPEAAVSTFVSAQVIIVLVANGVAVGVGWALVRAGIRTGTATGEVKSQAQLIRAFRRLTSPASPSMVLVAFQLVGLVVDIDLAWSGATRDCAVASFHTKYALTVLLPVVFLGLVFGTLILLKVVAPKVGFFHGLDEVAVSTLADAVLFTITPLLYIPMSRATLLIFDCVRLPNGRLVLDTDPGVACFDAAWWGVAWLGLCSVVVYVVGIPLYFAYALGQHRHELFSPQVTLRLGALYRLYRRKFYWCGVGELGKRLVIVLVAVFFSGMKLLLIGTLLMVLVTSLLCVARWQPYYFPLYNSLDMRLNAAVCLVVFLGAASYAERQASPNSTMFLVSAIAAVIVLLAVSIHGIAMDVILIVRDRRATYLAANDRQRRLMAVITSELQDVEAGPDVLRDAGRFLASLDSAVAAGVSSVENTTDVGDLGEVGEVEMDGLI